MVALDLLKGDGVSEEVPPHPTLLALPCFTSRLLRSYGFVIEGSAPVHVAHIEPGGPAENAGVQLGDRILEANGVDMKEADLAKVASTVQVRASLNLLPSSYLLLSRPPCPSTNYLATLLIPPCHRVVLT